MKNADKIQSIKSAHPFKIWDLAVYILVAAAVVGLLVAASGPAGSSVRISYFDAAENMKTITLPLDKDDTVTLPLAEGHVFIVTIKGGMVWAAGSDCRDQVCIGMGKISRVGQQIICLPNKVTITITGESFSDGDV